MNTFKGTREAFAAALTEMAVSYKKLLFISADSLKAMRAVAFAEAYPERYVECGIAEQSAVDVAAGLAACGMIPFVGTYAGFLTMRACEQMRTFTAYPNLNVKFIGINGGLIGGEREGVTHQFYEDLGILSVIPNFTIFTPADPSQVYHAVHYAAELAGPVYIRAASGREIDVYPYDTPFNPAGFTVLRNYGSDVLVFASGFILDRVLAAAELLLKDGIKIKVVDVNILGRADEPGIIRLLEDTGLVFTVEDHNINGGLGSYICHLACTYYPLPVHRIGLSGFGESGPAKMLADHYGFSAEKIASVVKEKIKKDGKCNN
jgi:transketolase